MEIFDIFVQIVLSSVNPVVFEFGTCDGQQQIQADPRFMGKKNQFKYHGDKGDLIDGGQLALYKKRYLYTEYSNDELYEGEVGLDEILKRLPGSWTVIEDYGFDILLKNYMYN